MTLSDDDRPDLSKPWWLTLPGISRVLPGYAPTDRLNLTALELVHDPVMLRPAQPGDYPAWLRLRTESRAHLTRWEPDWRDEDTTLRAFTRRLRADHARMRARRHFPMLIFRADDATADDATLVGGINLSDIRLGNRCSGTLGYWIADQHKRCGLTFAAIEAMVQFAFGRLGLNRVEAACQPGNIASRNLLMKSRFALEGVARDYLMVNGNWCDHEIWACTRRVTGAKR